ncbi:dipeptide epimerase [Lignipirellula cremea]|uniref:Dipeptide epimerase n=1 Tax=Lignipirellula cremea TaxID=2528010 RepID=A0A518DYL2_9BACT|nr:dipeptide epimerase [Lignipirellula cremea]QDU96885.1 L-Ala-D/L-Glu epimerase [Lignipirellula cremea]
MKLSLHAFDLPLKHPFTISRESITVQQTLIVELSAHGSSGFGEATTNRYYGHTLESMTASLERIRPLLEASPSDDPVRLWETLQPELLNDPFALCALDQAAYDLWGKLRGEPVWKLWGLSIEQVPQSSFTIGIDRPEFMEAKLREEPGWPCYKIKLGNDGDVEVVRRLRGVTDAVLRVDANCGWTADEAIRKSQELAELGVEFIEQPLPADDIAGMDRLAGQSALPLMADESCQIESDVDRCAAQGFHAINIKLVKCGGLTPARRMIDRARERNLKIMVGCMTESTVGISAIAQLLPLLDYVDMDGACLLSQDIAQGVQVVRGECRYPNTPGSGVSLLPVEP